MVYKNSDGSFSYTKPVGGGGTGVNPANAKGDVPAGSNIQGDYHTHGDYSKYAAPDASKAEPIVNILSDLFNNADNGLPIERTTPGEDQFRSDDFSSQDKDVSGKANKSIPGFDSYLGTPSGDIKKFDPTTGDTTTIGSSNATPPPPPKPTPPPSSDQ